jgi:carbon monoxide dehydrogenase subunit G
MKIENEFTVGVPIERAWEVLTDLEGIAPCLPGARLTGVEGEVYTGKVKIKVGPVVSEYAGTARFAEKDDAAYRAVIDAKGRDSRGAGNASAAIHASLRPDGDRTVVSVSTDLNVSGKIAQFGSGMIKEVSGKLMGQFAANLEEKLLAPAAGGAAGAAAPPSMNGSTPAETVSPTAPKSEPDFPTSPAASVNGSAPASAPAPSGAPAPSAVPGAPSGTSAPSGTQAPSGTPAGSAHGAAAVASASAPSTAAAPAYRDLSADDDPEPLDLMAVAGGSVYKRLIPVGIAAALVVVAVIVRRLRR